MHSVEVEREPEPHDVMLGLGVLITEGRLPGFTSKGYGEGPHCLRYLPQLKTLGTYNGEHFCASDNHLCSREENLKKHTGLVWSNGLPLCIEVFLCSNCQCSKDRCTSGLLTHRPDPSYVLLEQWMISASMRKHGQQMEGGVIPGKMVYHVVRSFLHFSQLSAWLAISQGKEPLRIMYRVTMPGEDFNTKFARTSEDHDFPTASFKNHNISVKVKCLPRLDIIPQVYCSNTVCPIRSGKRSPPLLTESLLDPAPLPKRFQSPPQEAGSPSNSSRVERSACRAHKEKFSRISPECKLRGKHYCTKIKDPRPNCISKSGKNGTRPSRKDLYLQSLIEKQMALANDVKSMNETGMMKMEKTDENDNVIKFQNNVQSWNHNQQDHSEQYDSPTISGNSVTKLKNIPTFDETLEFRKSFNSATSMVFHGKTDLPLTSSPAPLRKGQNRFDFDSTLVSPTRMKSSSSAKPFFHPRRFSEATQSLLGSFEESVLKGRLEPVSTVEGFFAEIGASGSFCADHVQLPATVFFYNICDKDKLSMPYMAHLNLGKKGYEVPKKGTVQVTLFNPLRTVIKMFVVMYDLSDMPANSCTFIRQRTLYMPLGESERHPDAHKWLRYLIHLRFSSSSSGKIYLHTDLRIIIFRKSDADAAMGYGHTPHELRSFTYCPTNPKYSGKVFCSTNNVVQRQRHFRNTIK